MIAKLTNLYDIMVIMFHIFQMEEVLPRQSGTYLKIILGSINVSILDNKARYDYKDQYEQFKLIVTMIGNNNFRNTFFRQIKMHENMRRGGGVFSSENHWTKSNIIFCIMKNIIRISISGDISGVCRGRAGGNCQKAQLLFGSKSSLLTISAERTASLILYQ
jgi:hypothetical protein